MSLHKIFVLICFGILLLAVFPMLNTLFTADGGLKNIVGNATISTPYNQFERMVWGNWQWVMLMAGGVGIVIWAFKGREN